MKFKLLIKNELLKYEDLLTITQIDVVFIMLINVKMPTACWHFNICEHDKVYAQLS